MKKEYPNLKPWPKGVSGNPGGLSGLPDELRGIKSLSQHEVTKIVSKMARMTSAELQTAAINPDTPMLEVAIASVFAQSAKNGDYARLSFLLDRAIGKVPTIELTGEEEIARRELQEMSDHELIKLVKAKMPEFEDVSRGTK